MRSYPYQLHCVHAEGLEHMKRWISYSLGMVGVQGVTFDHALQIHSKHSDRSAGVLRVCVPSDRDFSERINRAIEHAVMDVQAERGYGSGRFNPQP